MKKMTLHSFLVGAFCVLLALAGPLYFARDYLPDVNLTFSEAAHECTASGKNLGIARDNFARSCGQFKRDDCDKRGSLWICSNSNITKKDSLAKLTANSGSTGVSQLAQSGSGSACTATGANLSAATKAFAATCSGQKRQDCDPVGGGWVCSSEVIGSNAPGRTVSTGTANTTPSVGTPSTGTSNNGSVASVVPPTNGGVFTGTDENVVVIEAESTSSSLGKWKRSTAIGGYSGSGHITYEGGTTSGWTKDGDRNVSIPTSPLRYTFEAPATGTYRLMMRLHRSSESGKSDHSNDGFVRLEGDFDAPSGGASKQELSEDHKYFGGGTSWAWNGQTLDIHPRKEKAEYILRKGEKYTLVLSGRSKGWSVDRIVFAPTNVSIQAAQGSESTGSVTTGATTTTTSAAQNTAARLTESDRGKRSVGRYQAGDLVSLHYDYCPDPDDGHATVANKAVVDKYALNYLVVGGTCGYDIKNLFKSEGRTVLNVTHGGNWLDAMRDNAGSVQTAGKAWAAALSSGKQVHVAEGGQSDFTADVLRWVAQNSSGANLKKVFVYQHSQGNSKSYNEINTRKENLAYVKNKATYVPVANGNQGGNGSPDLGYVHSPSFEKIALEGQYGAQWKVAFDFLDPSCSNQVYRCKLDFSDSVELLAIVGDLGFKDVNGFAQKYLQSSHKALSTPNQNTLASGTSVSTTQTSNAGTQTTIATTTATVANATSNTGTTTTASGVCQANGSNLTTARSAFASQCAGYTRADCDPVGGGWICSSEKFGANAVGSTSTNTTSQTTNGSASTSVSVATGSASTTVSTTTSTGTVSGSTTTLNIPVSRLTPKPTWADSYSTNGQCYCATTFDHNIGGVRVGTPSGQKTVREICAKIGSGPGKGNNPVYNDVQCGHGPANDAGDEDICPGRVDQGKNGCRTAGPTWNLAQHFPATGQVSNSSTGQSASTATAQSSTSSSSDTSGCTVSSVGDLKACIAKAKSIDKITLQNDISCTGGDCCPGGQPLMKLSNVSGLTIEGNGNRILRTDRQRSCHMVDIDGGTNITFQNITLDDDERDPACNLEDKCSIMLDIRRASNIAFRNVTVANGKRYVIYTSQVNGFTFSDSELYNSGVLGLYVGHSSTPSTNVRIENSHFHDNATNGLALLGVSGSSPGVNIVEGNLFERNHKYGRWAVTPKYGTGFTGGGQVYIAQANGVTFRNNTIKDGVCENCIWMMAYKKNGTWPNAFRSGASGLELGLPGKASVSNLLIEGNTIINNDANGIRANSNVPTDSSIVIKNNTITGNASGILVKNATISGNTVSTR